MKKVIMWYATSDCTLLDSKKCCCLAFAWQRTFDKKLHQLKKFLLNLPQFFRANACRYGEHSWKFSLEMTQHKKVAACYATSDCTLLV